MDGVKVGVCGHSFVRQLANYALVHRSMNLDLDPELFQVAFVARGGLKVEGLYSLTQDIVRVSEDIIFLDIGTNDITNTDPIELGDRVLAFANFITVMAGVRRVVISQMYFRNASQSAYYICSDFNDRVRAYNQYMFQATKYFESIDFWGHRGVWADWPKYLVDGVHFTQEGNRKYYNSVRGAVIAAANKLM